MAKIDKTVSIQCNQGLHARPAALFVQIAEKFSSQVSLEKDGERINGKSIMGILMLGAQQGSSVRLIVDGDDADQCANELERFLLNNE